MRVGVLLLILTTGMLSCSMAEWDTIEGIPNQQHEGLSLAEQRELLQLINELRAQGCTCGRTYMPPAPPLSLHEQLTQAARVHAADMEQNSRLEHKGSDGSRVSDRLSRMGYRWSRAGENIAWGYRRIAAVFQGWLESTGHCENMMSPAFVHFGAARQGEYWVTTFGRSR